MGTNKNNPRVLVVTPEVTYLPEGMGNMANYMTAKAGGLADVSAALINALFEQGVDVHVALPDYRTIFNDQLGSVIKKTRKVIRSRVPDDRIHLAEDRVFYYQSHVYSGYGWENIKIALAFQREIINNIIPEVKPDLIHCNDWMTGLIPAVAREMNIPCLFTIHNIFTVKNTLAEIEDRGIDAASFWNHLYYEKAPINYEETRGHNPVDYLTTGIFASHFVNTVSPTFLQEMVEGRHPFVEPSVQTELRNKWAAGCAVGILNSPDPVFDPDSDKDLILRYDSESHPNGKKSNKQHLQKALGLIENQNAPLFFWPSRLDTVQKGCQLLADILYATVSKYWEQELQIVFVANGEYKKYFNEIVWRFNLEHRVVLADFNEQLSHIAFAASDFVLMPSAFEPCGLPQMIGPIYGSLPVAHNTGGIHDTVQHLDVASNTGNGFLFDVHDGNGLAWSIEQAVQFHNLSPKIKAQQITRIMKESKATFNHATTARQYIELYEQMLQRPFLNQ